MKKLLKKEQKAGESILKGKNMRFPRVLVFIFLINLFGPSLFGSSLETLQDIRLTIKENDVPISKIISEIEKQTNYSIIIRQNDINLNENVSLQVKNEPLISVLDQVFRKKGLQYQIKDYTISIFKATVAVQQKDSPKDKKSIRGVVTDESGEAIIGASIVEKGTSNGTITDANGEFQISTAPNATLSISYIGFAPQEISVANQTSFNIILKEDQQILDDVVVVGYGVQKKVNLTGAITAIKANDISQVPVGNLSNALAGRAPGVTVSNNSGMAGSSSKIRIRGSFAEPLYVINNVIKSKEDFDALDPNEVDNISFLKDAASASIYGSKAGNGVVLVTTKSGTVQKPMFTYQGMVTSSSPTKPIQSWNSIQELDWGNNVHANLGLEPRYGTEIYDYFKDKSYELKDYVWQNPFSHQHNLTVNGGSDRITYFMSLGFNDEDGSYKTLNYKKYNFRSDITAQISNRFKVNFNISGNQRDYKRFYWQYDWDEGEGYTVADFYRTTFNHSRLYPFYVDKDGNPSTNTNDYPVSNNLNLVNLVLGDNYRKIRKRNLDAQIRLDLDLGEFVQGLSTSFLGQINAVDLNNKAFYTHNKSYRFQRASTTNPFIPGPVDPNDMVTHNLGHSYEGISEKVTLNSSYQVNLFLNYARQFDKHGVTGTMVYEQYESENKNLNGSAENLLTHIDQIFVASNDASRRWFNGSESEGARQSVIGRFNYNFDSRYIAEFSFRVDGNDKFAKGQRWGFFPSGSLAWRVSEESFLKQSVDWLSNLKLRGSYGSTGDDNRWNGDAISGFQWRDKFVGGGGYYFGTNYYNGIKTGNIPNPNITWAKLEVWDVGVDFGFLNNRLNGEFDYYYKNKNGILMSREVLVPGTYGATFPEENYAEQEWHGFETTLNWQDSYRGLNYKIYANLGYSKDKWIKRDEPEGLESWRSVINRANGRIDGFIAEKILRTQEDLDALPAGFMQFGREPKLGQILYRDIRGDNYKEGSDGKIDDNDKTYLSYKADPRINYGFGFNLEWKGITLDAHFQGVGSYDRMIKTNNGGGVFQIEDKPYFELWTGDVYTPTNINAKYPAVTGEWKEEYGAAPSTFWLQNGAYLRLKHLNIGYNLPSRWIDSIGLKNVKLFFNATNLFYISSIKLMDPEQEALDSYPMMKSFSGGLSITF